MIILGFFGCLVCFACSSPEDGGEPGLTDNRKVLDHQRSREMRVIKRFEKLFRKNKLYQSFFLGVPSRQYPTDNWIMQEIIWEVKPDFIIETGSGRGGTSLFYATVLGQVNPKGKVITIDIRNRTRKARKFRLWRRKVRFVRGDSASPDVVQNIAKRVKGGRVLVTLDSDHSTEHVLKELRSYSPLVSRNSYLIVQDTFYEDNAPMKAIEKFLQDRNDFEIDRRWEKYLLTQNRSGYLKRVK